MTLPLRIACGLALAVIWACSSGPGPGAVSPEPARKPSVPAAPPEVLRIGEGAIGPYLMPVAGGWVAAWAAARPDEDAPTWHTATFGDDGRSTAAPRALMGAPAGLSTLRLRALNPQRGLIVGAFETADEDGEDQGHGLTTLAISSAGTLLAGGSTLVQECDPVVWIEVVPLPKGALVVWAEDLGDHAELFATNVDLDGNRTSDLFAMHPSARAWQVVQHSAGAMLGVVTSDGNVDVVSIDASGTPRPPQVLLDNRSAQSDLDLAASGDRVLVAFSDGRNIEPRLYSAWVSLDGSLRTVPQPMTESFGAATLIGLRALGSGLTALWQNTSQEPGFVRLGRIDNDGRLTGAALQIALPPTDATTRDVALPRLDSTATTLVVMEPPCSKRGGCKEHADVLELSSDARPQYRLTWPQRSRADLVWDFQCGAVNCAALSAEFGQQTTVRVLSTANAERTLVNPHKAAPPPVFEGQLQAVASTAELAALGAASTSDGALVATLSAFDPNVPYAVPETPAPDGRLAPVQAELKTLWFGHASDAPRGRSPEVENTISIRARSVAGVDLVNAGEQSLLVWTAIDNADPQVFVTLLDGRGRKVRQAMLTRQSGEILAVSASVAPDGFFYVAWVREAGKQSKTYLARLSPLLVRQSTDALIATSPGTISGLQLAATKASVFAVLAANDAGTETLEWVSSNPATLQRQPAAPNPLRSPEKSTAAEPTRFSPRLVSWGDGFGLAWLEVSGDDRRARLLKLDDKGDTTGETSVSIPAPTSALDLACARACRLAITGDNESDNRGYLVSTTIAPELSERFTAELNWVTRVLNPGSSQVAPAALPNAIYYSDKKLGEAAHLLFEATPASRLDAPNGR